MNAQQPYLFGRERIERNGVSWLLRRGQLIDDAIRSGAWEAASTAQVEQFVQAGMVCLDVGANTGYYTMLMAPRATGGRVVAVEPMLAACSVLCAQVALNGFINVEIAAGMAFSDVDEIRPVHIKYAWPPEGEETANMVRFTTLDRWWGMWGGDRLDLIKVDTDGFDLKFLRGARETICKHRPHLLLEVCGYTLGWYHGGDGTRESCNQLVETLLHEVRDLGYSVHREDRNWAEVKDLAQLCADWDFSKTGTNVWCRP